MGLKWPIHATAIFTKHVGIGWVGGGVVGPKEGRGGELKQETKFKEGPCCLGYPVPCNVAFFSLVRGEVVVGWQVVVTVICDR